MPSALITYRRLGISVFMLIYLASTIQVPILEVAHLLAHAHDIWHGIGSQHTYQAHEDSHQHTHLALWDRAGEHHAPHAPFLDLTDLEKKSKYLQNDPFVLANDAYLHNANFTIVFWYRSHYQEVDLPPPQLLYC